MPEPTTFRAWVRAIEQAGIRTPGRGRRVGDYELGAVLGEGDNWQDFAARHTTTAVDRRVRVYPYARAATPEARDRLARTALREFRVLEGLSTPAFSGDEPCREVIGGDPPSRRVGQGGSRKGVLRNGSADGRPLPKVLQAQQHGRVPAHSPPRSWPRRLPRPERRRRSLLRRSMPRRATFTGLPRQDLAAWNVKVTY
jgi:hypothetical protein